MTTALPAQPTEVLGTCNSKIHGAQPHPRYPRCIKWKPVAPPEKREDELFYIQDARSYCGNSVVWWCLNGKGYTSNLEKAWRVPATWVGRDTDKLWPCAEIDKRAARQFDMQLFREVKESHAQSK